MTSVLAVIPARGGSEGVPCAPPAVSICGSAAGPRRCVGCPRSRRGWSRPRGGAAHVPAQRPFEAPADGGHGVDHDKSSRPRRRNRPRDLPQTGAAYALDASGFRERRHRFFGRTGLVRADPARVPAIDDPYDLTRPRALPPLLDASRPSSPRPTRSAPAMSADSRLRRPGSRTAGPSRTVVLATGMPAPRRARPAGEAPGSDNLRLRPAASTPGAVLVAASGQPQPATSR